MAHEDKANSILDEASSTIYNFIDIGLNTASSWHDQFNSSKAVLEDRFTNELLKIGIFFHYLAFVKEYDFQSEAFQRFWELKVKSKKDPNVDHVLYKDLVEIYLNDTRYSQEWHSIFSSVSGDIPVKDMKSFCPSHNFSSPFHEEWCSKCIVDIHEECLNEDESILLKKYLGILFIIDKYFTKERVIDILLNAEIVKAFEWFGDTRIIKKIVKNIQAIDSLVGSSNVLTPLEIWSAFNWPAIDLENEFYQELFNSSMKDIATIDELIDELKQNDPEIIEKWLELMKVPKVHGDYKTQFVFIPLCSFGSKELNKCSLFKPSMVSIKNKVCYTFNRDIEKSHKAKRNIEYDKGLNFVINYRFPKLLNEPIDMIVHEAGTMPDLNNVHGMSHRIYPQKEVTIAVEASYNMATTSFKDLPVKHKKCEDKEFYDQINCLTSKALDQALEICGCSPWYSMRNDSVCTRDRSLCFESTLNDDKAEGKENCPRSCTFSKFYLDIKDKDVTESVRQVLRYSYGKEWEEFYSHFNPLMIAEDLNSYWMPRIYKKSSLVHINFGNPRQEVIIKDAKVTGSDKLGTVGGTFGVFIGLSILSIIDFMYQLKDSVNSIMNQKLLRKISY